MGAGLFSINQRGGVFEVRPNIPLGVGKISEEISPLYFIDRISLVVVHARTYTPESLQHVTLMCVS